MKTLFCGNPSPQFFRIFNAKHPKNVGAWLATNSCYLVHKARVAIRFACQLMDITEGDEILAPSYNCGTEIDALISSRASIVLYRIDRTGQIDFDDLCRRINQKTKVIYVTHYFGFPQPLTHIKKLCEEKGIYLVEDCALSLFSSNGETKIGSVSDISVYSLPKTLPVPDGGALVINNPDLSVGDWRRRKPSILDVSKNMLPLIKRDVLHIASSSKHLYPLLWSVLKKTRITTKLRNNNHTTFPDTPSSYYYDEKLNNTKMSVITECMLRTFDVTKIVNTRRANFLKYLELLSGVKGIEILYKDLPEGVCPLYFPIIIKNRWQLCKKLNDLSIDAIAWWAGYHRSLPWAEYPDACLLKDNLLVLPVHQQLSTRHVVFIASAVLEHCAKVAN